MVPGITFFFCYGCFAARNSGDHEPGWPRRRGRGRGSRTPPCWSTTTSAWPFVLFLKKPRKQRQGVGVRAGQSWRGGGGALPMIMSIIRSSAKPTTAATATSECAAQSHQKINKNKGPYTRERRAVHHPSLSLPSRGWRNMDSGRDVHGGRPGTGTAVAAPSSYPKSGKARPLVHTTSLPTRPATRAGGWRHRS